MLLKLRHHTDRKAVNKQRKRRVLNGEKSSRSSNLLISTRNEVSGNTRPVLLSEALPQAELFLILAA
jgi:hypothetical protein